ncbi:major facilitator superfamily domain-containing protein 6 [Trichonephila inaurata madagascariensis]|uniref:Major facilitator superfamily domain-containing protein 6 n=1 Tax=Trichonephila inaurata madagascariensis TaxID=2747483 RepID=A0A8X6YJ48_9ARAC|nr:major facilitator superfamily domain-containing protein 6 [Trichonephila inaurata madagascariensis]
MVSEEKENGKSISVANNDKDPSKEPETWEIDKEMIRFKLHFFLLSGAMGSTIPFLPVIARDRVRLSATSFATVLISMHFMSAITKPVIGFITDYFNKLKMVLCVLAVSQGIFLFLLLLIPAIPKEDMATLHDSPFRILDTCDFSTVFKNWKNRSHISKSHTDASNLDFYSLTFNGNIASDVPKYNFSTDFKDYATRTCSNNLQKTFRNVTTIEDLESSATMYNQSSLVFVACSKDLKESFLISVRNCAISCYQKEHCDFPLNSSSQSAAPAPVSDFQTYQFWLFVLVFVAFWTCKNAVYTLSDTACCESVQKHGADFGKQRLFGAVGWGLVAAVAGLLCDFTNDYLAPWILFAILSLLMLWNISKIDLIKPDCSDTPLKDISKVMNSKKFIWYEIGVLINGIGWGFVDFYLNWFLISIGGNRLICGLVETVQCLAGEIPFMFFSGWMLKKFGHFNIMALCLISYCGRFLWYSQIRNPWLVLPIEWTHGISFGVFYNSMASFAKENAPLGSEATTQSVVFSTYEGLGSGIGDVVAGVGFDYIGSQQTFFYAGIFFGSCAAINLCLTLLLSRRKKSVTTQNP